MMVVDQQPHDGGAEEPSQCEVERMERRSSARKRHARRLPADASRDRGCSCRVSFLWRQALRLAILALAALLAVAKLARPRNPAARSSFAGKWRGRIKSMGADLVIAFYGVRYEVGDADDADALDASQDERLRAAKLVKLQTWVGRITDGEPHHLLIGRKLGVLGVQGEVSRDYSADDLAVIARSVNESLAAQGLVGEPRFWFILEAQY
jgi:hypothetical protein